MLRCLGIGGMGAVYEIEHELTKHRRALKLLHASMAKVPGVVERFLREASAAGRVGNPHIVETFDAGTLDTGEPYLVMEILRGQTLTDRIERGPMPVAEMVDLIGQACDGIQAAHEAGIVHRDLKPDNLFVIDVEGRPFVKILDFGISKFDPGKTGGMALTQEGAALGTPYYMSPEQIRGEINLDARTDVYALGVILYECAAGIRPFEADSLTQLAVLIHTGDAKPLASVRTDLPPGFADLVMRAMTGDREKRTQTAQGLRADLERFGSVSFRGLTGALPAGSVLGAQPAKSAVPAKSMATSAAGVSVRQANTDVSGPKSNTAPIVAGFGVLAAALVGGVLFLRSGSGAPAAEGSASAVPVPAAVPVAPAVPPTPAATPSVAPAPEPPPPPPAAARAPAPPVSGFPVVAPTLKPLPAPPPAQTTAPAGGPAPAGAPAPAPVAKPRRTEEKGLAKDNPFR
ncbi:MAG TPA: serine/threonine-protein kinase [Polyangiaceae bacterium]|nr:serine/threonine-protein kinase [Polyangiaceae bacterium]